MAQHAHNHVSAYAFNDILWVTNMSSTIQYDKKIILEQLKEEFF